MTTNRLRSLIRARGSLGVEPALCLYLITSFIKYPIFQEMLYEKSCEARYHDAPFCSNTSLVHNDLALQKDANQLFLYSSLCLLLPSIPTALLLGSLSDVWSAKIPILIPLVGLILGDVNYIIQSVYFSFDPRWLLLSDLLSGFTGGYATLMGMMFSCSMKQTDAKKRSRRMAFLEGSIGVGATLGFALSGIIRESLGFANTFILLMVLRIVCFIYVLTIVNEIKPEKEQRSTNQGLVKHMLCATGRRIAEVYRVLTRARPTRPVLILVLIAFAIEILAFSGVNDIQYSFFRFKLQWASKQYGWFKGLSYAFGAAAVMTIYPWMKSRGVRDMALCSAGLITKIVSLVATGFVFAEWFAYAITPLSMLNRFIATSIRATASKTVDVVEQGKVFSLMSILDGIVSLCGSLIFNSVYPHTLPSLSYLCFLIVAVLLLFPLFIAFYLLTDRAHTDAVVTSNSEILHNDD